MDESVAAIDRPFLVDDLVVAIADTPVRSTVVVQASMSDEETDWLLTLAAAAGPVVGVVGWVDLASRSVGDRLAELGERGGLLRGIRHQAHDEADPRWLVRADVVRGLGAVADAGLAYDLLIRRPESAAAAEVAAALPGLRLVVDHAAKPGIAAGEWEAWRADLAELARHENVVCKVSGLVTEAGDWRAEHVDRYITEVLELFGPERCLFGSDWPVCLLAASYDEVLGLAESATGALSTHERNALFAGTAREVYGL